MKDNSGEFPNDYRRALARLVEANPVAANLTPTQRQHLQQFMAQDPAICELIMRHLERTRF